LPSELLPALIKADGLTTRHYNTQRWLPWAPFTLLHQRRGHHQAAPRLHQSVRIALSKQSLWGLCFDTDFGHKLSQIHTILKSLFDLWLYWDIYKYPHKSLHGHPKTITISKIHSSLLKLELLHITGQSLLLWDQREKQ